MSCLPSQDNGTYIKIANPNVLTKERECHRKFFGHLYRYSCQTAIDTPQECNDREGYLATWFLLFQHRTTAPFMYDFLLGKTEYDSKRPLSEAPILSIDR